MTAAYLDESFDKGPRGIFAVGGLVGHGVPLFELARKWEQLLQRIGIEYFKASECESGIGQFAKLVKTPKKPTPEERQVLQGISHEFVKLIADEYIPRYGVALHGIGVVQEDFYEVIKDDYARSILGDQPFELAYDLAMIQCAWMMKQVEKNKKEKARAWQKVERYYVSIVRDDHERYGPLAAERYAKLKKTSPQAAEYMASHSMDDDKKVFVLQAADAVAYEIRRVLHIAYKQWNEPVRKQFQIFRDTVKVAIIRTARKQELLNTVRLHKPGEGFKLDEIMEEVFHENIRFDF